MKLVNFKDKKIFINISSLILIFVFILPIFVSAKGGDSGFNFGKSLVTCDGSAGYPCDFDAFIKMINRIINWIISISTVIFAISLIYGGFLYMTSGENPGNKSKAIDIMWNTLKGFVIVLIAWLIVYTILINLVDEKSSIFRFIGK